MVRNSVQDENKEFKMMWKNKKLKKEEKESSLISQEANKILNSCPCCNFNNM